MYVVPSYIKNWYTSILLPVGLPISAHKLNHLNIANRCWICWQKQHYLKFHIHFRSRTHGHRRAHGEKHRLDRNVFGGIVKFCFSSLWNIILFIILFIYLYNFKYLCVPDIIISILFTKIFCTKYYVGTMTIII